jgi:hypothetical protein
VRFRPRFVCALLAVTLTTVLSGAPGFAADPPAADSAPDVAARIATLTAASQTADAAARRADARRDGITADVAAARVREAAAESTLAALDQVAAEAKAQAEAAQGRVAQVVRQAYVDGGTGADYIAGILDASSAADLSRRQELTNRVGERQDELAREYRRARARAVRSADEARSARDAILGQVAAFENQLPAATQAATAAEAAAATARLKLDEWTSVAGGPDTPIMGVSRLTGDELARWFAAQHREARTTVPIGELADDYISEGDAAGVRGDIAFAQSILETGSFSFPEKGQVHPADNNFSGLGACDSCATGRTYPDALTGVRAQIQLLRAYADPNMTAENLGHPPVDPKLLDFFLKGRAPTWAGLTGTWATSTTYAPKIFEVYLRILAWVTDHPDPRATGADGRE